MERQEDGIHGRTESFMGLLIGLLIVIILVIVVMKLI